MCISHIPDWRHALNGLEIPTESYSDQPYIVQTDDGAWLCVVTTGLGHEGQKGQHVVSLRSTDRGRTWTRPVDVEPADGPEASYAVLLKAPGGRVFVFYNHNTDRVPEVRREDGGVYSRVDSLGHFVFRYSDDHGCSWSPRRYDIPVRRFACDLANAYGGELCFFWNVGKAFHTNGEAFVPLHKVGAMGEGFFAQSEGALLHSPDLLRVADPAEATWETLPEGDVGLRTPPGGGRIAEEQSFSVLADGSFYCVYRSVDGHPVEAYSRDRGRTWTTPRVKAYADGRPMKHPRAANFVWRCRNGRFLHWFHNHGGCFLPILDRTGYNDRNPVWLSAGEEIDTPRGREIRWSEPEIVLYDDDPHVRMSYPDLIEEDGTLFLTETNKDKARVHAVDATFLDRLFAQFEAGTVAREGLLLDLPAPGAPMPASVPMPRLPEFLARDTATLDYRTRDNRAGITLELRLAFRSLKPGQCVLDSRGPDGRGILLQTGDRGTLEIQLHDGRTTSRWDCDPGVLTIRHEHHVGIVVDGGPKIISFVVDGRFHDGGQSRQFGWGRFNPNLRTPHGAADLRLGPSFRGTIRRLRLYGRALQISEIIANHRSGE
ncbi:MAG: exo-alpha-sialidase [Lentisphaeria bacterium]|nr:exo-alpha-sialidase [Lentisphaeria bacterium]